ncbi:hypothetical protein [Hespellia stercorisuis]|uniref:Uncharacterized protein n=1 Tax=Hespellia stercorisuis DSM 15480 TaxID=1121950 RepID=A0A1M6RNS9_9FIRM|nr:hypothetical protein [Hespellia stercorisuis]SHK34103.1 hypothetical protein SAMN02745243_02746 [Hespellia stercorisuis DSM 15480]
MAGYENIKDYGFDKRTAEERRELAIAGGKASGEARRRKADFRKTLNLLLTEKIDSPEWTPVLEALGVDSTLEAALNMAMIKEGLAGNVKAYEAIARYSGQSDRTESDQKNVEADTRIKEARAGMEEEKARANENEETADDGFIDALSGSAAEDWADEED